jgi:hypothetical protein
LSAEDWHSVHCTFARLFSKFTYSMTLQWRRGGGGGSKQEWMFKMVRILADFREFFGLNSVGLLSDSIDPFLRKQTSGYCSSLSCQ